MGRQWTDEDRETVTKLYNTTDVAEMAKTLGRTPGAIQSQAKRMGVTRFTNHSWGESEIRELKRLYGTVSGIRLAKKFGVTRGCLQTKAYSLGITKPNHGLAKKGKWTESEVAFLRENYDKVGADGAMWALGRSRKSVHSKVIHLGLSKSRVRWTDEDDDKLKELYGKVSNIELSKIFKRSVLSIQSRAIRKRNLKKYKKLTEDECKKLDKLYGKIPNSELSAILGVGEGTLYNIAFRRGVTRIQTGLSRTKEVTMLRASKSHAKRRGLGFNLTIEDIVIPDVCPLLGVKIVIGGGRREMWNSPSIDRINSKLGYVKGNVWIVSRRANVIKNDATVAELKAITTNLERRINEDAIQQS